MRAYVCTGIGGLFLSLVVVSAPIPHEGQVGSNNPCDAPEFVGICDPFVPGVIVGFSPNGGVRVVSTWPGGPADEAGVCPGDEIVAVGGAPASYEDSGAFLSAIVSNTQIPIALKIKRGNQQIDFRIRRVRESTLAALSREKYTHLPFFPSGERLVTVPLDEGSEELEVFRQFEFGLGDHFGFKLTHGRWVPKGTPEDQSTRVAQILADTQAAGVTANLIPTGAYGIGCSLLVLSHPSQILIGLIEPGSAAYQGGLFPGDQLLEVDGHPLSDLDTKQLSRLISEPEDQPRQMALRIKRGTSDIKVSIETAKRWDLGDGMSVFGGFRRPRKGVYLVGFQTVDGDSWRHVVVSSVTYPSPAFDTGVLVGDVILSVNGESVEQVTRERLSKLLSPETPSPLALEISRLGKRIQLLITPVTETQAQAGIGRKITANGPASRQCAEPSIGSEGGKN